MVLAEFKTAYLQREIPVKANVSAQLVVGQVCTYNPSTKALAAIADATAVANGQYIVAQSDVTMGDSHVPVERRNYNYSNTVAVGNDKLVALYLITDVTDVVTRVVTA